MAGDRITVSIEGLRDFVRDLRVLDDRVKVEVKKADAKVPRIAQPAMRAQYMKQYTMRTGRGLASIRVGPLRGGSGTVHIGNDSAYYVYIQDVQKHFRTKALKRKATREAIGDVYGDAIGQAARQAFPKGR